jgi:pyruvate formate lyase activating enzyme
LDPDIPWHISRFHPDYRLTDIGATPVETIKKAYTWGKEAGLRYIYMGNVPGESAETLCPKCRKSLISRRGFLVKRNEIKDAACPICGQVVAGIF